MTGRVASPWFVAVTAVALAACSKHGAAGSGAAGSASAPPATAAGLPAPVLGRLSTSTAFELVASHGGATLVVAGAERGAAALETLDLDAGGAVGGVLTTAVAGSAVAGDVSDLAAAWVGPRLALAWLERRGGTTSVRAAWAKSALSPFELGAAWSGPRTSRGNVVVAARGDQALVFARGDEAACIESGQTGCFAFGFHELQAERAVATGLPMSVPVPCTEHSAALAVVGSRFHYGVCTEKDKRSVTTL
ncbi:MAG TPA: hypothetical protein VGQ57_08710, partial [Polyangiaceae bacterium]|nr:hypothetical protein [Polyangiaceae bacterium]